MHNKTNSPASLYLMRITSQNLTLKRFKKPGAINQNERSAPTAQRTASNTNTAKNSILVLLCAFML
jgi:hypothetical protein